METELKHFPLYCPKCEQESLVDAKDLDVRDINRKYIVVGRKK